MRLSLKRSILTMLLFLGLIILGRTLSNWMHAQETKVAPDIMHFHPDMVLALRWNTQGKKPSENSYSRTTRRTAWSPGVDSAQIQSKLNFLAVLPTMTAKRLERPLVTVRISFGPGNEWEGQFDGQHFYWSEGQLKGQAADINKNSLYLFQQGEYAFEALEWSWCNSRPQKISVHLELQNFTLNQEAGHWFKNTANARHELNATGVEQWLGHHCVIKVQSFRDLHDFPLPRRIFSSPQGIEVTFVDGNVKKVPYENGYLMIENGKAIQVDDFKTSLKELASLK
jgi:hypothetical protein